METGYSTAGSIGQTLFNIYKLCRFALDTGVPGLALNQQPYIWLTAGELLRFSSAQSQEEFYKVTGIQTALFIPCGNGVVELGTTNLVQADEQNELRIRSLLATVIASTNISVPMPMSGTSISASSCSSLLSCSIDNPWSADDQINIPQDTPQYSELTLGFYPYLQTLELPSSSGLLISGHDYETTLVSPDSSQQINVPDLQLFPQTSQASDCPVAPSARSMMLSAFGMWRPPSKVLTPPVVEGQYRIKKCLAILRNIYAERVGQTSKCGSYRPPGESIYSGQVHHMISERRRREKLKESFEALRSCIPPASREGAATSAALQQQGSTSSEGGDSVVTVEVSKMGGTTTICDEMGIVVVVDRPTNTIDLMIALLKRLKEMGVPLISTATSTAHHEHDPSRLQFRMTATIRLQDQAVVRLKEELMSALGNGSGPLPPSLYGRYGPWNG